MKIAKKILSVSLSVGLVLSYLLPPAPAQALFGGGGGFSYPSPTSAMNQIFADLGVDKGELRNTIATSNTSRQKKQPPQVSLVFFPENPTPGEMVTATAQPSYFLNDSEDLYFTWYLKRDACDFGSLGSKPATCDSSGDGDVDIEDYKITAARKIANGDFDWDRNGDGIPDPEIYSGAGNADNDKDGYYPPNPDRPGINIPAPFGGNTQIEKNEHCFLHNFVTGNEYEIGCAHLFPRGVPGTVGDGQFTQAEEEFWHTDPENADTAGTTRSDEANVLGLGVIDFSWNYQEGDLVGVAIEGSSVEATQYRDSSFKTMWALPKNRCDIGSSITDGGAENDSDTNTTSTTTTVSGMLVVPNPTCTSFSYSGFGVCQPDDLQYQTVTSATPQGCVGGSPVLTTGCTFGDSGTDPACTSFTYPAGWGACQPNDFRYRSILTTTPSPCYNGGTLPVLSDSCTYTPSLPPLLSVSATSLTATNIAVADWPATGFIRIDSEIIGYGGVTSAGFTGLSRGAGGTTASTHADGATITGYATTTETEITTQITVNDADQTATTLIVTAVTVTVRDVRGNIVSGPTTTVSEVEDTAANGSYSLAINDLNDCLYENMLPPSGGNEADKLKVSLSFSPSAPMGLKGLSVAQRDDPLYADGENTDTLIVNSSLENIENADFLKYDWVVYAATNPDPLTWVPLTKADLTNSTQMSGIGVKTLSFKLKFANSPAPLAGAAPLYLKVKLDVSENRNGTTNSGRASVVVPITSIRNQLLAYSARVDASDQLYLNATPRCENLPDEPVNSKTICPVAKNEIVGMRVNNSGSLQDFMWTIDGKPINYSECFFVGCDINKQTDTMFFPIFKDPGTQYVVNLVATDTASGQKINVTRIFEVVTPAVKIVSANDDTSADGAKPVVLGEYINTADPALPRFPDKSESSFLALQGTNISLCPIFNVPSASFTDAAKTTWNLDGQETVGEDVAGSTSSCAAPGAQGLIFGATKDIDQSYTVSINAIYRQDENIRRVLNRYWSVPLSSFYETQLSDTIDVSVTGSLSGLTLSDARLEPGPKKFLASLSANAPGYLNFLFRIVITTFLLLYFVKVIFSLLPRTDAA